MRRPWVIVLALALAAVVLAMLGKWQHKEPAQSLPGLPYSLGPCHTWDEPVGAAGYNRIAAVAQDSMLVGGDVAASIEIGDGGHVWMFGDTTRTAGAVNTAVRNSMVVARPGCRAVVLPPGGGAAIPDRPDGVGYWPMGLLSNNAKGITTLYVTLERVRGSEQAFHFVNLGPALATFAIPDGQAPRLLGVIDWGADDPSTSVTAWGAAMAPGTGGWVYVYGTSNPHKPLVFGWAVRLARVRANHFAERRAWTYWNGRGWSNDEKAAVTVISAMGGVSQTFSVVHHDTHWYAISKRDGDLGTDLAVWSAPSPWGPFADAVTVGLIPNSQVPPILRYMPLAHPELMAGAVGSVVVSVSRNAADQETLAELPTLYRPFFIDVALPPRSSGRQLDPMVP